MNIDRTNCYRCGGDPTYCHPYRCPIRIKMFGLNPVQKILGDQKEVEGPTPPSFFVGSQNYPHVSISPMVSVLDYPAELIDEPDIWKTQYSIPDIVKFRAHLIRARAGRVNARNIGSALTNNKTLELTQELLMTEKPTFTSTEFEKPLKFDLGFNKYTQPMGPGSSIKRFTVEDTPKTNFKIERVVFDTDLLAHEGITKLWDEDLSATQITRILSAGMLGRKKNRILVPTRWSITAIDDIIGKNLIEEIKDYPNIDFIEVWSSDYLDNHFRILFRPKLWGYEFFESWQDVWSPAQPGSSSLSWITGQDYELYSGRKDYVKNTAGGYYAARLAVLEYLARIRRQAEAIEFRENGEGYYIPLGVWQVRENCRNAFTNKTPLYRGHDLNEALNVIKQSMRVPIELLKTKSILLNQKFSQVSLLKFF